MEGAVGVPGYAASNTREGERAAVQAPPAARLSPTTMIVSSSPMPSTPPSLLPNASPTKRPRLPALALNPTTASTPDMATHTQSAAITRPDSGLPSSVHSPR